MSFLLEFVHNFVHTIEYVYLIGSIIMTTVYS